MVAIVIKLIKGRLSMEAKLCGYNGGVLTEPKVVHLENVPGSEESQGTLN